MPTRRKPRRVGQPRFGAAGKVGQAVGAGGSLCRPLRFRSGRFLPDSGSYLFGFTPDLRPGLLYAAPMGLESGSLGCPVLANGARGELGTRDSIQLTVRRGRAR
jgi:hypothetical protein